MQSQEETASQSLEMPLTQSQNCSQNCSQFTAPPVRIWGSGVGAGVPLGDTAHGLTKIFNDSIHEHYELSGAAVSIIDSPPFQRLRELKQLGLCYWVFPGASHNRFEHSLGVAHLGRKWVTQIYNTQRHELDMDQGDIKVVELAGLCHDLGHGPMSHVFDTQFLQRIGVTDWHHEEMSSKILDMIRDTQRLDDDVLTDHEVLRIKQLFEPSLRTPGQATTQDKAWLFDIIANERNSIDVDKMDYLERDAVNCKIKISCDLGRLPLFSMVRDNQICFKSSEAINIRELFHSRELMHRTVYSHKKVLTVNFMAVDVLVLANEALHLRERIRSAADFVALDDTIFTLIEHYGDLLPEMADEGADQQMKEAQRLIRRIRNRDLYVFVNEVIVPPALVDSKADPWKTPTAQDIVNHYSKSEGVHLRAEDVIVWENKIDYTRKAGNPLDDARYYHSSRDGLESFTMAKGQMTTMMPEAFQERAVRLYSKVKDEAVVRALGEAFDNWAKFRFKGQTAPKTPLKQLQEQPPSPRSRSPMPASPSRRSSLSPMPASPRHRSPRPLFCDARKRTRLGLGEAVDGAASS